jgi:hypothetical protein
MEEVIKEIISQLGKAKARREPGQEMVAHEPQLIDQLMEWAMQAREKHPLRQSRGESVTRHGHVF